MRLFHLSNNWAIDLFSDQDSTAGCLKHLCIDDEVKINSDMCLCEKTHCNWCKASLDLSADEITQLELLNFHMPWYTEFKIKKGIS